MRLMNSALICAVLVLACGEPMTDGAKLELLEGQRQEIIADLTRQQAECQAQAIEFANAPNRNVVVESCTESVRTMAELSRHSISDIDQRIAEIRGTARLSK